MRNCGFKPLPGAFLGVGEWRTLHPLVLQEILDWIRLIPSLRGRDRISRKP